MNYCSPILTSFVFYTPRIFETASISNGCQVGRRLLFLHSPPPSRCGTLESTCSKRSSATVGRAADAALWTHQCLQAVVDDSAHLSPEAQFTPTAARCNYSSTAFECYQQQLVLNVYPRETLFSSGKQTHTHLLASSDRTFFGAIMSIG